jgi:uridine kinase
MHKKLTDLGMKLTLTRILAFGLLTRILLVFLFVPKLTEELFFPFLYDQSNPFDFTAVNNHMVLEQSPFPYGLPMYLVFLPVHLVIKVYAATSITYPVMMAIGAIAVIPDFIIMRMLVAAKADVKVILLWILSPIVIWSSYYLGQTDLWPALLLLISCHLLLNKNKYWSAGSFLGLAIGCKYGVAIVLPFILIFMLDNPRYKRQIRKYLTAALVVAAGSYFPAFYSKEFRHLILESEVKFDTFSLFIDFQGFKFFLVPAIYLLLLVWIYRAGRTTTRVLIIFLSVSIVSISILTPSAFGWVIWSLPALLVFLNIKTSRLVWVLGIFQSLYFLAKSDLINRSKISTNGQLESVTNTILVVFTIFLLIRILQHGVAQGDKYQLAVKPFTVAVAGDSGVGKDSFARSIVSAFGAESTTVICGDDFHLFERGDFIWGSNTHLNPRMNNLHQWTRDISMAVRREHYQSQEYDHANGRFRQIGITKKSDLVISQGLHALYPHLSVGFDAKIFLEMEKELRLSLKMQRDTTQRGRTRDEILVQLEARSTDYTKYIEKQREDADFIIRFIPDSEMNFKFIELSTSNDDLVLNTLQNGLLTYCPESLVFSEFQLEKTLKIDVTLIESASVESILRANLNSYEQFFPAKPNFSKGVNGLIQVTTFLVIEHRRGTNGRNNANF